MKPERTIRIYRMGPGHRLPQQFLVLALVAMVTMQTATNAFSQEEVYTSPSTQESTAPSDPMKSVVLQIPEGTFVEVQLTDGGMMRGQLGELLEGGFILRTVSHNRLIKRLVRFEEVKSLRPVGNLETQGQAFDKNLNRARKILGLVIGGVSVGLLIAVVVAR